MDVEQVINIINIFMPIVIIDMYLCGILGVIFCILLVTGRISKLEQLDEQPKRKSKNQKQE